MVLNERGADSKARLVRNLGVFEKATQVLVLLEQTRQLMERYPGAKTLKKSEEEVNKLIKKLNSVEGVQVQIKLVESLAKQKRTKLNSLESLSKFSVDLFWKESKDLLSHYIYLLGDFLRINQELILVVSKLEPSNTTNSLSEVTLKEDYLQLLTGESDHLQKVILFFQDVRRHTTLGRNQFETYKTNAKSSWGKDIKDKVNELVAGVKQSLPKNNGLLDELLQLYGLDRTDSKKKPVVLPQDQVELFDHLVLVPTYNRPASLKRLITDFFGNIEKRVFHSFAHTILYASEK